mmetsp:Transcript_25511/g.57017  ORF Transcript_25511/g.57017 Transcript_25511/m.57017 type:complete len:96 (+) Transcript_25511:334-621(+)
MQKFIPAAVQLLSQRNTPPLASQPTKVFPSGLNATPLIISFGLFGLSFFSMDEGLVLRICVGPLLSKLVRSQRYTRPTLFPMASKAEDERENRMK